MHLLPGEAQAVSLQAAQLGVVEPVVDGQLRQVDGRCVFLLGDQRCAIHAAFGGDAKPLVCRQFPFVRIDADGEVREGVDPASHAWAVSRLTGPLLVPPATLPARLAPLPPEQRLAEAALLAAIDAPGATLASTVNRLCGRPASGALPADIAARWHQRLRAASLVRLLDRSEVGPLHRQSLAPLLDALQASPTPSPVALPPDAERIALALVREVVALRLVSRSPLVALTGLTLLLGATSLAGVAADVRAFQVGLATWCRVIRAPMVLTALFPNPEALRWVVVGGDEPVG